MAVEAVCADVAPVTQERIRHELCAVAEIVGHPGAHELAQSLLVAHDESSDLMEHVQALHGRLEGALGRQKGLRAIVLRAVA